MAIELYRSIIVDGETYDLRVSEDEEVDEEAFAKMVRENKKRAAARAKKQQEEK